MGAMKDIYIESRGLTRDWIELIAEILTQGEVGKAYPMKPDEAPEDEEQWEQLRLVPDLSFSPEHSGAPIAIEFKMFRWQSEWRRRLRDAITHMREILAQGRYSRGIIILSMDVSEDVLSQLMSSAGDGIDIWSLQQLRRLAAADDVLHDRLETLALDTAMDRPSTAPRIEMPEMPRGAAIAARLRDIPAGFAGWQAFETACADAIIYLFGAELHNPSPQVRTDGGLHRMDLICRIRADGRSFWSMISSDFSTRYVVFDAKNYDAPIGQDQVTLTAKYLFAKGLRTVAIIVAREGASDNAKGASAEILREDGKLILTISRLELCAMLEGADAGDPPENILFGKMDAMLMQMSR